VYDNKKDKDELVDIKKKKNNRKQKEYIKQAYQESSFSLEVLNSFHNERKPEKRKLHNKQQPPTICNCSIT
jgi:hypothetical protein